MFNTLIGVMRCRNTLELSLSRMPTQILNPKARQIPGTSTTETKFGEKLKWEKNLLKPVRKKSQRTYLFYSNYS